MIIIIKCTAGYKLSRLLSRLKEKNQSPNVHGWHSTICKKWKRTGNFNTRIRIYSRDIWMEFGIERCAMRVMKSGKWHLTDGMELPNQDKIRTPAENEICKYLSILEVDTIIQVERKNKIQKEYIRRTRKLLEAKPGLYPSLDIPGLFSSGPEMNLIKWTKEKKIWPCIRHCNPETALTDYMYQEKREEEDLAALKTALMHR